MVDFQSVSLENQGHFRIIAVFTFNNKGFCAQDTWRNPWKAPYSLVQDLG